MVLTIQKENLKDFIEAALFANTIYFRERRLLWEKISSYLKSGGEIEISNTLFNSIKSFLCARNDQLDDNKTLAFNTAVEQLSELIAEPEKQEEEKQE